jgi:hypothetical protein
MKRVTGTILATATALTAILLSAGVVAQSPTLPADVDPQSFSRLPFVQRDQLSGDDLAVFDRLSGKDQAGNRRPLSPGVVSLSLHSPGAAVPLDELHAYLTRSPVGPAMFQIAALVATREFDEPFNWNAHEGGALRAKVDQRTIDAIKFNRAVEGLPDKDALVIRFGRALFRDHTVSPELYAQVVATFGKQGLIDLTAIMGDYALVDLMMRAVDQHVPNATYPLPALAR